MAAETKIKLSADIKGFAASLKEVKEGLESIGKVNIPSGAADKFKKIFSDDLLDKQKQLRSGISTIEGELKKLSKVDPKVFDHAAFGKVVGKLSEYNKLLKEVNGTLGSIKSKGDLPSGGGDEGGGGTGGGILGKMKGGGKLLGAVAGALGVRAAINRRVSMAQERMDIMSVTTDNKGLSTEKSKFGFTPSERRKRATELARASGDLTGRELNQVTDMSEQVQRAYGVSQGQSARFVGASRRSGTEGNQTNQMSGAIGAAISAGFSGSKIEEFLGGMSGYLEEMSKGVDIDQGSLRGMAGAIGGLPFFQNDPNRIFDALRSMNTSFQSGDRFQQAQATRAILKSAPGSSPAMTEFRREMGLFGEMDAKTMKKLDEAGVDTRAMKASGGKIVGNIFDEIMGSTEKMTPDDQLMEFKTRTGLSAGASADIFGDMKRAKREGKPIDWGAISAKIAKDQMSPEEKLGATMGTLEGKVVNLNATMESVKDKMAENIADPLVNLATTMEDFISQYTSSTDQLIAALGTAAAVFGVGSMLGAGKALGKGGEVIAKSAKATGALPRAAGAATKAFSNAPKGKGFSTASKAATKAFSRATGKGTGKAVGKGVTKGVGKGLGKLAQMVPFLGTAISLGFVAKDSYDIYQKWQNGEEISNKDWAILTADLASMVPFIGTAAAAGSVGLEFAPDDLGMGGAGGDTAMPAGAIPGGDPAAAGAGMDMSTPSDNLPTGTPGSNVLPFKKKGTGAGAESESAGGGANTGALFANTAALNSLTAAIRSGGSRFPSGAKTHGNRTSTGKG